MVLASSYGQALGSNLQLRSALALLAPITFTILIGAGFPQFEIQDSVAELWIPDRSSYAADREYRIENGAGEVTTNLLVLARARDGHSTMLDARSLLEHDDAMTRIYATTVNVRGNAYDLSDVCLTARPYLLPCVVPTVLDCFYEGSSVVEWQPLVLGLAMGAPDAITIPCGLVSPTPPNITCGEPSTALYETLLHQGCTAAALPSCNSTAMEQSAKDAIVSAAILQSGLIPASPYDSKPKLRDGDGALLPDAEVRAAVSGECFAWDGGSIYGEVNKELVVGSAKANASGFYEYAGAIQAVFVLTNGAAVQQRLRARPETAGGARDISLEEAMEVLEAMKAALEESAVAEQAGPWESDPDPARVTRTLHSAFSDDAVVPGTFTQTLRDETYSSINIMIVNFLLVGALAALFFVDCASAVRSRVLLALSGVALAVLAFLASLGLVALASIKLNIITMWVLPFLLVGIGVDDMFIITYAVERRRGASGGAAPALVLGEVMAEVLAPVSLTSLINLIMFAVMARSDLSGVYETAYVAMVAVTMLWAAMVTALPALIAFDLHRQASRRSELCPCSAVAPADAGADLSERSASVLADKYCFRGAYLRALSKWRASQLLVGVLSAALLATCAVKVNDLPLGLELNDFARSDTWVEVYFVDRSEHFPLWPISMNFGALEYENPLSQLGMLRTWENVAALPEVSASPRSGLVWTASMAAWAHPAIGCVPPANALYTCGPEVDPNCTATFYPNVYGLKTRADGGVCADFAREPALAEWDGDLYAMFAFAHTNMSPVLCAIVDGFGVSCSPSNPASMSDAAASLAGYKPSGHTAFCPVLDVAPATFDTCASLWLQHDPNYALLGPEIKQASPGAFEAPVLFSQVGGSQTNAVHLYTTEDYLTLIRNTRGLCDDSGAIQPVRAAGVYDVSVGPLHCFMSGVPYDYWEQYLTIETFLLTTILYASLAAVAVACAFLACELLSLGWAATDALQGAVVGAILIAAAIAASVVSVVGLLGWVGVPLSGISAMSSLCAVGFATEFAVHITHAFLASGASAAAARAEAAMRSLFVPMLLAFLSSLLGILLLLATTFGFVLNYVFKPMICCLALTYFYGCVTLPLLLQALNCLMPKPPGASAADASKAASGATFAAPDASVKAGQMPVGEGGAARSVV
ncbi:hypothetical protein EMIHUDRAFT_460413 [Emiliania huxleyi CCMP1516]|uniref:SSD domain-containing protein n=2 Tax=Emiliania huxleyi TaxID=2903 RepID=A0A0D3KTP8_EMIH1|nr:hypothetical protein EMIHUDRAFT_460413 [Emiliania huxleyi CCMP1516]EOD39133.1 hypothetical protein EMIHUDRAFT_460413 [Emiliania huxleyi CCMP1516]|eukprot:XP_005791562.1 hypothetical protein EMIHUDRAFT_460413 [Emiliania huxleyi CCMP1516]